MKSNTIKHAIQFNLIFIGYLLSPNLSTFFGILIIAGLLLCPNCITSFSQNIIDKNNSQYYEYINQLFNRFLKKDVIQQIAVILLFKLAVDLLWLVPSWLIIFFIVEIAVVYGELQEQGIITKIKTQIQQGKTAIKKFAKMIPKYNGVKNE